MKNVKINDIANELGISRNTVSKVLNGKKMPEKTKKRVLEKAAEMNYKQLFAQSNQEYRVLLLSAKPLANINFFIPIIRKIENVCFEKGYQLFQYVCLSNENTKANLKEYIKNLNIDGIICIETFSSSFVKTIMEFGVPVVFLDGPVDVFEDSYDIIIQDNYTPIKKIINILADKGAKSFGFVGDINHCLSFLERYEAMLLETGKRDIPHDSSMDFLFDDASSFYRDTTAMINEIRSKDKLCDAYICANDFIARRFINVLALLGKNCPKDVKVIGFDDSSEAISSHPHLTTMKVDSDDLAATLINILTIRIRHPSVPKKKIIVGATLIENESTLI